MITAAAVWTACSSDAGGASGSGSFGAGGTDAQTDSGTASPSSQTAASTGTGAGSGGSFSGGGGDGGFPANCADTNDCGNFGGGCVKCEVKSACAAEYEACFDDPPCKSYSACVTSCGVKDLTCLQTCESLYPTGATEYQALTRCVICGSCVALCDHAPDICK